jgi:hypothetical protein
MAAGIIELWFRPRDRGTCRGATCHAPIIWREGTDGRKYPFTTDPDVIERRTSSSGRLIEIVSIEDLHHRTCPDVDLFRQADRRAAAPKKESAPCLPLE